MKVTLRTFEPDSDSGFIYGTLPKSIWYGPASPISELKNVFFRDIYVYLHKILPYAKVLIACTDDNPDVILGYAIINGPSLEFVYVKDVFRKQGIATLLTQNKGISKINEGNLTLLGETILRSLIRQNRNPFKKEEPNEEETRRIDNPSTESDLRKPA